VPRGTAGEVRIEGGVDRDCSGGSVVDAAIEVGASLCDVEGKVKRECDLTMWEGECRGSEVWRLGVVEIRVEVKGLEVEWKYLVMVPRG